ncbi:MAG TPA: nucleotide sugar dehydrogenase [Candidatus Hydrogenedentes bacterium]|jgi:UDP-N-acetyl-D-mannosaminuronic acid dehydrogenase|nr:MAG: UDP-N-acetyl-D-glucosamine 6-dehydrogenase [Candidatus Hydrogenedentes bacterium ADurb.Bin170]HOM48670.1 nucleotide sugar dehydrogenase [Candidatus Hydrogenedentota bacterium]HOR49944.1 nucleotide sugar dehydrogenase [Candidatus Hydrogenedentota bacterium]
MNKVCVLGLGYIGLPTAAVLSAHDLEVIGVDLNPDVVKTINQGAIHIEEPGLSGWVQEAVSSGKLRATGSPVPADVFIIAVPTPITAECKADMSCVRAAAQSIISCLRPGNLVVLESTSPPGTCRDLLAPLFESAGFRIGTDLFLAYCPERVLPGKILTELVENDRVIGGMDESSTKKAIALYDRFVRGKLIATTATTAEVVKLMENTYRDVNIALANETALLCEELGVDYWEMARCANHHPRVHLHSPGPGVGGHCIAVDPWFLVEANPEGTSMIQEARRRNDDMPRKVAEKALAMTASIEKPVIAVLGLAYKADVDDLRESPALKVTEFLQQARVDLRLCDPFVKTDRYPVQSLESCLQGADMILLLTDHSEFKTVSPVQASEWMRNRKVFDTRRALPRGSWVQAGFEFTCLGVGL